MTVAENRRYRGLLAACAVAYLAFVIYGSLVPFSFTPRPLHAAWQAFQAMPYLRLGIGARADWVANILLFIPLSFLAAGAVDFGSAWRWLRILGVFVLCVGLAATIEILQVFFPPRTVALNDIVAESLGALAGVVLWLSRGPWLCAQLAGWARATHRQGRAHYLFYGYLLGMAVFNLLPLDLTLSVHDVYDKWKEGRLVLIPFGFRYGSVQDLVVDLVFDVAAWIPVGILGLYARAGSRRRVLLYCVGLAALLEFLQVFVYSRVTDATDILTAALGCSLGIVVASRVGAPSESAVRVSQGGIEPRSGIPPTWLWAALYALGVLAALWYPFDFRFDAVSASARYARFWAIPFESLYFQSEFRAISNVALKAGLFAPLGVLLALGVERWQGRSRTITAWGAAFFVVALAFVAEIGQIFLPAKYPDVTDVALESGGAFMAALLVTGPKGFFRGPRIGPGKYWWLIAYAVCVAGVWAVTHWPGAPYNVRELLRPGLEFVSAALLGLAILWLLAFPALAAASVRNVEASAALYRWPALLAVHAAVAYLLIRLAVPEESIRDIVGTPVLDGLRELEWMGRATVLIAAIVWLLFVGELTAWTKGGVRVPRRAAWAVALLISAVFLPFAHWVVVVQAATDNLTELMRDGGGLVASAILSCFVILLGATGAWLARIVGTGGVTRVVVASVLVLASCALGFWLITAGTESAIIKYGRVFSALQFLLSTNRDSYAESQAVLVRFSLIYVGTLVALGLANWPLLASNQSHDVHPVRLDP
jgi:glycopeptide antibiotics resistance protein